MRIVPVELFTCKYNEGKGAADLDEVVDRWNKWADKNKLVDYAAWTLTPYYFGSEQDFDVIWLGAGKDAVALGKAQDSYMAETDGLHAAFAEVVACDAHVNYASFNFKAGPRNETPSDTILTFSDCSYKEGATFEGLANAMGQWSKHLADGGSNAAIFHWYPAYGGGGEEFDFKWLQAYGSMTELGADFERYGNGGGWKVRNALMSHMISCDSNRAYVAKSIRFAQLR